MSSVAFTSDEEVPTFELRELLDELFKEDVKGVGNHVLVSGVMSGVLGLREPGSKRLVNVE